ncbi:MAG: lysine exporter LysO family protein [Clostridiales bacterium]|nr:lysine exporter LysO family protein [Clostridiales bacterium]
MKLLAMCWSALILMYIVGMKLRSRKEKLTWVEEAMNVLVYLLVLLMGLRMGANKEIVDSLGTIGVQSLIVSAITITMSMLGITLSRKILRMDRYGNVGDERVPKGEKPSKETGTNVTGIKSTIIIGVVVALGMAVGYFLIYKKLGIQDEFMIKSDPWLTLCLVMLIGTVGLNLGLDGSVFRNIKKAGAGIILFPIAAVLGSVIGGVIYGLITPLSIREGVAIASGFGWYTYAPNVILQAGYPVASAISFLHNVIREVTGIIGIPFLTQKIGYIEACAVPGVAAMDVCMPIVERSAREDTVVYSFGIGLLMCLSVPIIVPLVIGA